MKDTIEKAKKVLGADAKVPAPPADIDALRAQHNGVAVKYKQGVEAMQKVILDAENLDAAFKNALKMYKTMIDKANFGLDPSDKEDAKKIAEARKILNQEIAFDLAQADASAKSWETIAGKL